MRRSHKLPQSPKFLMIAFFLLLATLVSAGQDTWTDTQLGAGVVWRQKTYSSLYGGKQTVNVIQVDLSNSAVTLKPIRSTSGCKKTSVLASGASALAAINGGFFDGSCGSLSMTKVDNTVYSTNPGYKPARATFGLSSTKTPYIQRVASTDSWSAVTQAQGGGPNLVTSGARDVTLSQEGFDSSYANKNPRTAIGFAGTKVLMVTVDGRTSAGVGMTLNELADFMIALGCNKAMNLDGGGSTAAYVKGTGIVNTPSDGTERSVVSAIGVWSQPVTVIVDNTSTGFSASSNWWASSSTPGYYGTNYHARATAAVSDAAQWSVNLPSSGSYKVYARWTAGTNRAASAPYQVTHSGGTATVNVNQQQNNGTWVLLGTWNFSSGTAVRVKLSCWTTAGYYVIADAVKFEKQ